MTEKVIVENMCERMMVEKIKHLETELLIAKRKVTNAKSLGDAHVQFA